MGKRIPEIHYYFDRHCTLQLDGSDITNIMNALKLMRSLLNKGRINRYDSKLQEQLSQLLTKIQHQTKHISYEKNRPKRIRKTEAQEQDAIHRSQGNNTDGAIQPMEDSDESRHDA
jgi:hypothetical protein